MDAMFAKMNALMKDDSIIHDAVATGNAAEVERLLKDDPKLANAKNRYRGVPLERVTTVEIAQLLVRYGADVNGYDWTNNTPLCEMVQRDRDEIAEFLIAQGANVNGRKGHNLTPLFLTKNVKMARLLLQNGASVSIKNNSRQTPLFHAILLGDLEFVTLLIEYGAEINSTEKHPDDTPLHSAVAKGSLEIVRALLDHGADVTLRDETGMNPLQLARQKNQPQIVELLEQHITKHAINFYQLPEHLSSRKLIVNPKRSEAITVVDHAILARWELGTPIKSVKVLYTDHWHIETIAASPDGETILVCAGNTLELRNWDTLKVINTLHSLADGNIESAMFSQDGRWLALPGFSNESISVIELIADRLATQVPAGERTQSVCFDPSSQLLATTCSFQGGGHVRVDRIKNDGTLQPLYNLERSDNTTPASQFVDTLVDVAFSPDSRHLALFETSAIYHDLRPEGWRGDLLLYSIEDGSLQWQNAIDATITGDKRSLREADSVMGFYTQILFLDPDTIACGSSVGNILLYDKASGKLVKRLSVDTEASVIHLGADHSGTVLWVLLSNGELVLVPIT